MRMVEFCQESTSPLTAVICCLLLASCSFRVSNSCWLAASCFFRSSNSCWLTTCPVTYGEIWHIISESNKGYLCSSPFCAVADTRDDVSTAARIISSCILLVEVVFFSFTGVISLQTSSSLVYQTSKYWLRVWDVQSLFYRAKTYVLWESLLTSLWRR